MLAVARFLVLTAATATTAMTLWLASVIVLVLPGRDPGSIPLWTIVAAGSGVFVALTVVATRDEPRSLTGLVGAFGLGSALACTIGIGVLIGQANRPTGHSEGYLLAIGLILGIHGMLGLGWFTDVARRRSA